MRTISLDAIDWQNELFRMSYFPELSRLKQSIEQIGLQTPPLMMPTEEGRFLIVHGWRRLLSLKQLGWQTVTVEQVAPNSTPLHLFTRTLFENLALRGLNFVEMAFLVERLAGEWAVPIEEIQNNYLPFMGGGSARHWLNRATALRMLPEDVQEGFAQEKLTLDWLEEDVRLSPEEKIHLMRLSLILQLGKNRQKELLMLTTDVRRLTGRSVNELLNDGPMKEMLSQENMTSSQKTTKLLTYLRQLRFPRFSQTSEQFQKQLRKLKPPHGTSLKHSPYFEEATLTLEFRFRSERELQTQLQWAQRLVNGGLNRLLQIVRHGAAEEE